MEDLREGRHTERFISILADLLLAQPSVEELTEWARRNPDKWGSLVVSVARLAGCSDGVGAGRAEMAASIHAMSDAELREAILEAAKSRQGPTPGDAGLGEAMQCAPQPGNVRQG